MLRSCFLLLFVCATGIGLAQKKPNFIVILTDDQQFDAVRANNNPAILTPNLDRLFGKSRRFSNAHAVFSLCSPSRAAVMTGRYGSANGVMELGSKLNAGEKTVAQYLKERGYLTGVTGKWHIDQLPGAVGFDYSSVFLGNGPYHNRKIYEGDAVVQPAEHCDAYCARRATAFLQNAAAGSKPFFLFHCTQLPHMDDHHAWPSDPQTRAQYTPSAMPVPANKDDDLTGKPAYLRTVRNRTQARQYGYPDPQKIQAHTLDYYAVITEMDAFLGGILRKVDALGLADNTYIIFMSDNGWMLGDHGFTSKVLPYRTSTHVPMCVAGPNIRPATDTSLVLNIDLAPTILDLAQIPLPKTMHGRSLRPLLTGQKKQVRDLFVYEGLGTYGGAKPNLTVVSGPYRYIVTYEDGKLDRVNFRELYRTDRDPHELDNRADDPAYGRLLSQFQRALDGHIRDVVPPARSVTRVK